MWPFSDPNDAAPEDLVDLAKRKAGELKDKLFPVSDTDKSMAASNAALTAPAPAPAMDPLNRFLGATSTIPGMGAAAVYKSPAEPAMAVQPDPTPDPVVAPPQRPMDPVVAKHLRAKFGGGPAPAAAPAPVVAQTPPPELHFDPRRTAAPDDELRKAQAAADDAMARASFRGEMNQALNLMTHHQMDEGSDLYKREGEDAQRSVKNVLQRREAARQTAAENVTADLNDPNSAESRLPTLLAQSKHLIPPGMKISATQWGLIKDSTSAQEAAEKLAMSREKDIRDRTSAEKIAQGNNSTSRYVADKAYDRAMDKGGAGSEKAPADVPAKTVTKLINQEQINPAIDDLEKAQANVGASGLLAPLGIHVGAEGEYNRKLNAHTPAIASGGEPDARQNVQLLEKFKKDAPAGIIPASSARQYFETLRQSTNANRDAELQALRLGKANPTQIDQLEAMGSNHLRPGEVTMRDPKGVPHAVGSHDVSDAVAHGWSRL